MSFFDQIHRSLFPRKEQKNQVLVHELIKRGKKYTAGYNAWTTSAKLPEVVKAVASSYQLKAQGIEKKPDVHLFRSEYGNGFAISYSSQVNSDEFRYFFDWLADSIEQIGYRRSNSDVTIIDKGKLVETREKHYLKPISDGRIPITQRYGNILIEYILIDDEPSFIKLVANIYNDRSYSKPEKFENLAEYLFELA